MPRHAAREDVLRLLDAGAQVVEVLPREEYDGLHLAGARSIPLAELDSRAPAELSRSAAVVVYCNDFL